MAFLDENGLVELWSQIRAKDAVLESAVFDHAETFFWNKYSEGVNLGAEIKNKGYYNRWYCWSADRVTLADDGVTLVAVNPSSQFRFTDSTVSTKVQQLWGKYLFLVENDTSSEVTIDRATCYYVPTGTTVTMDYSDGYYNYDFAFSSIYKPTGTKTFVEVVSETSIGAYPAAGMQNGYYYEYKNSDKAVPQIACGSFKGNGGTNTINLGFQPKFVFMTSSVIHYFSRDFYGAISGVTGSWTNDGTGVGITATGFTFTSALTSTLRYIALA